MNSTHIQRHAALYGILFVLCAQQFITQFTGHVPTWIIEMLRYVVTCAGIIGPYLAKPPALPAPDSPAPAARSIIPPAAAAVAIVLLCLIVAPGCASTASQTIDSASTRFESVLPTGARMSVVYPGDTKADHLKVTIDPQTATASVDATNLQTSKSQIIDSAGTAQANAIAAEAQAFGTSMQALSTVLGQLMPLVQSALAVHAPAAPTVAAVAPVVPASADVPVALKVPPPPAIQMPLLRN
jgi:hypothetical protein